MLELITPQQNFGLTPMNVPEFSFSLEQEMINSLETDPLLTQNLQPSSLAAKNSLQTQSSLPYSGNSCFMEMSRDPVFFCNRDPECCYFLEQLQGCYETQRDEYELIEIVLAGNDDHKYGIVMPVSPNAKTISDWLIFEEDTMFTLCCRDRTVKAAILKGTNTMNSLTWYTFDGTPIVWKRTGEVAYNLLDSIHNTSRSNSIGSVCSRNSSVCTSVGSLEKSTEVNLQRCGEWSANHLLDFPYKDGSISSISLSIFKEWDQLSEDDLQSTIKTYLRKYPSLLQRVISWGISRIPKCRVGKMEVSKFCKGRVWITASLLPSDMKNVPRRADVLNEFKGAYQEVVQGVYLQTPPKENEPGVQHRLRRSAEGLWIIEEYVTKQDHWVVRTQELHNGHWVDSQNFRKLYRVQIVPMVKIINRMKDEWTDSEKMKESLDFLYNSCNYHKLNSKVKPRSLRHNVSNLKSRLEKHHMLWFGVSVGKIANEIAFGTLPESSNQSELV